ncbi:MULTISPECIES: hypothetical protein [Streptomyces]|nr:MULTISPECIES: hypothetical protein [Streptomyces]MYS98145.1 hypothetical protein [Streptomyces sp. SID5469]
MLLTALGPAVCCIALILGLSACSGGNGDKKERSLTAAEVCDSTLDSSAIAGLKRMGDTQKFTELPGTDDSGEPNKFSLKRAASTIHDDMTQRNQCVVYKTGDTTGHPLIDVDFSAVKYHPNSEKPTADASAELTIYPIGVYAATHGNASASLYFKCPTKDPEGTKPYIQASVHSTADQVSAKATAKDSMDILNSVSRSMAKQLGCASQADLPANVPLPEQS